MVNASLDARATCCAWIWLFITYVPHHQIKQHKVLIDQREEEIKSLSQQIQKMETLIQELEQESARTMDSSTEQQLELEEHILRVTGEAAELRDKLEEVKEESWEAAREIEAAQVENEVLQSWMVELRTQAHVSWNTCVHKFIN